VPAGSSILGGLVAESPVDVDDEEWGVFFQDIISWEDHVHLIVGGRYGQFDRFIERENGAEPDETTDDAHDGTFVPRVGIVYQPTPSLSLYASYTESFVPNGASTDNLVVSMCPCDPEEGVSYELGLKAEIGEFQLGLAVYEITKENVLQIFFEPGQLRLIQDAIGEVKSEGFELDLSGQLTENLNVLASYGYTNIRVVDNPSNPALVGNELRNVAPHTGRIFLSYDADNWLPGLAFGGGIHYVDQRFGDNNNSFTVDSYTTGELFVRYGRPLGDGELTAQVNLYNLTDETFYLGARDGNGVLVGRPRHLRATIAYQF